MPPQPLHPKAFCCDVCKRRFKTQEGLLQHEHHMHNNLKEVLKNLSLLPLPPGQSDETGAWYKRHFCTDQKSFGLFKCPKPECNNQWMSAHAFKQYGQQCTRCLGQYVYAFVLWQNKSSEGCSQQKVDKHKKPHKAELCQACMLGKCKM